MQGENISHFEPLNRRIMSQTRLWRYLASVAILTAIYIGAAKLSLALPVLNKYVTPVWPPAGITQGVLFIGGRKLWPGVVLGEFLFAKVVLHVPLSVAIAGSLATTLQALVGVTLLRSIRLRPSLDRLRDVFGFLGLSVMLSTLVASTLGLTTLCWANLIPWSDYATTWWTWWLGDGMAVLVLVPAILTWSVLPRLDTRRERIIEAMLLLTLLATVTQSVFFAKTATAIAHYPLAYLPFPLVAWAALRFNQQGAVLATLLVSCIAIWGTALGDGPFAAVAINTDQALQFLQAFMGVIAVTALVLGAAVAERASAEASLRASEASLANAQRIAHLGNWDLDLVKQQLRWSDELYRILGFSPAEFEPSMERLLTSVHPDDRERVRELIDAASYFKQAFSTDFRVVLSDRSERIVHGTGKIIQEQGGKAARLIGTIQDVTEQKRIEQALLQSEAQLLELAHNLDRKVTERTLELEEKNNELARSLTSLKQAQQQLIQAEKMSSLGQLVAGIAHEINNPINFITGNISHITAYIQDLLDILNLYQQNYPTPPPAIQAYSETVELDFVIEDLPNLLESMKTGAERIRQIVISLRSFSRLDEADMKPVDIHEGIDSTLLILQRRLKARPGHPVIEVVKNYGDLPLVECYPKQLNQVFLNLLSNAIDALEERMKEEEKAKDEITLSGFSPQPFAIALTTQILSPTQVQIEISDNGIGMTPEVKNHIFEPFFTTKQVGKGTGLGLSTCYQIVVENHQGQLICLSQPGLGATFQIVIPLRQSSHPGISSYTGSFNVN